MNGCREIFASFFSLLYFQFHLKTQGKKIFKLAFELLIRVAFLYFKDYYGEYHKEVP